MITVKITGGLGNQMFQYAFGLAQEKRTGKKNYYDISFFENQNPNSFRIFELRNFNVKIRIKNILFIQKLNRKLKRRGISLFTNFFVTENNATVFYSEFLKKRKIAIFDGYFQNEKYFIEYRKDILDAFTLTVPLNTENNNLIKEIKQTNSISLHVRRGDYVNLQDYHGLCGLEYYKNAISYVAEKTNEPHFYLFSDDIKWVVENLKIDFPYTIVDINDSKTGYFDLELMKNCKHNIIANSSFSWWGAWLNENPEKIVIAPKQWFANEQNDNCDIIPESWIKI